MKALISPDPHTTITPGETRVMSINDHRKVFPVGVPFEIDAADFLFLVHSHVRIAALIEPTPPTPTTRRFRHHGA
jgi:hypothetical protein